MPTLALAILARDEAPRLATAIASVSSQVDAIVLRDTGSQDGTVEIARALGATVVRGGWHDDFAAARNLLLEAVETDWVLVLDADEQLAPGGPELGQLIAAQRLAAWTIEIESPVGFGRVERDRAPRLFRRAAARYRYRACEQLAVDGPVGPADLRIEHSGFMPSRRLAKSLRNLGLLDRNLHELPEDPYLLWRLGRELELLGRMAEAAGRYDEMAESLRSLDPLALRRLEWSPEAASDWAESLADRGEGGRALGLVTRVALAHPDRPLARFAHARALAAGGRTSDAACAAAALLGRDDWRPLAAGESDILRTHAAELLAALAAD